MLKDYGNNSQMSRGGAEVGKKILVLREKLTQNESPANKSQEENKRKNHNEGEEKRGKNDIKRTP